MTRHELVNITNKLGYPYIWQNISGSWSASKERPSYNGEFWYIFDCVDKNQFEIFTTIKYDGSVKQSILFYYDTLCKNKEEEFNEAVVRG